MIVEWKEPPASALRRRQYRTGYLRLAEALAEKSGEWAVAARFDSKGSAAGLQHRIKHSVGVWQGHEWEPARDEEHVVYVRHIRRIEDHTIGTERIG